MSDRPIAITLPRTLALGAGCAGQCAGDVARLGVSRVMVVTDRIAASVGQGLIDDLKRLGLSVGVWADLAGEPSTRDLAAALSTARDARAQAVVGLGGGSPMDLAKLVAALLPGTQRIEDVFGIGKLGQRAIPLACIPTTAGTGSEVSPNAIVLDPAESLKKGVISPWLVPDAAYVDPMLTVGMPPAVTASTGLDALTHCIEAYANRFAHPVIDLYALEGIRLIGSHISRAYDNGQDIEARTAVSRGSLYGGICLGPVNTGAVHALAYPLGSAYRVPHGVSNAMLLCHVMEFNLPAAPQRYARIALALGAQPAESDIDTARRGLEIIRRLCGHCRIPQRLADVGVPSDAIPQLAAAAMTVTRLLERNVRELTLDDATAIYRKAM